MSKYFKWAEVKERTDIDVWEGTTKWGNHDIYPVPKKERNYGYLGLYAYYALACMSISGFTGASAYVSAGLGVWETIGAIVLGSCIASFNAFFGSRVGTDKGLGFTIASRAVFGLRGAILPILNATVACVIFAGIQAYYGGQAVALIIGAVIPQFANMANTLPASAGIVTKELVGFFLYFLLYAPVAYFVPMHKLRLYMYPSIVITTITLFGMLGWAIHANGGTGQIISSSIKLTGSAKAFMFLQCVSSNAAVWSGTGDRFADWSRFARNKYVPLPAVFTALPILSTVAAIIGALTTSAFYEMYGTAIWTPLGMLIYVQEQNYSSLCRAGTFFAGIGLLSSQIYINITQNTVGFGIDWAGVMPRYATVRRGSMFVVLFALAYNPWRLLTQATDFIQVLNVFAVLSSCTGPILIADYWIVRRRKWKIPDLYHEDGIYWFYKGWNWRAATAWFLAMIPSFPGFVDSMIGGSALNTTAYKMYQMTFFLGYPLTLIFYLIFNYFWPPEGLGIEENLPGFTADGDTIEGLEIGTETSSKDPSITEKKAPREAVLEV